MHTRNALTILAAMAMAGETLALNVHRHEHKIREIEARRRHKHVHWVTVYETVTVYGNEDGEVKTAGSNTYFANTKPDNQEHAPAEPSPETSPEVAPAVVAEPEAPAPAPTTLATSVKAAQPAETPAPAPEPAAEAEAEPEVQSEPEPEPEPVVEAPAVEEAAAVEETQEAPAEVDTPAQKAAVQSPGGSKRGFAYNDGNLVNKFAGSSQCSWAYNWDSHHNGLTAPLDFVPMLWGDIPVHTNRWQKNADEMLGQGATHLLSFNEPDHAEQANMSPQAAAHAHVQYMNPYGDKARIGSPAITNSGIPGQGLDWLKEWVSACKTTGCKYDFCVAHWYAPASVSVADVEAHLRAVHEACEGKPVWLTEFAPLGSDGEIADFLSKNMANFDGLDFLERYSYFMMRVGSLLSSENSPSSYGRTYLGIGA